MIETKERAHTHTHTGAPSGIILSHIDSKKYIYVYYTHALELAHAHIHGIEWGKPSVRITRVLLCIHYWLTSIADAAADAL